LNEEQFISLVEDEISGENPRPCIICGQLTSCRGIFIPTLETLCSPEFIARFGEAPPDKIRSVLYPICEKCIPKDSHDAEKASQKVEEKLLSPSSGSHPKG